MHLSLLSVFVFMAIPVLRACEGECITGITEAFIGNYTGPREAVMTQIGDQIIDNLHLVNLSPAELMKPLMDQYDNVSYPALETAIFPDYFHGKCQNPKTGVEPEGCPNPDCPVVCGTPGSLVHFYSELRYIAFNDTHHVLDSCASASTPALVDIAIAHQPKSNSDPTLAPRILRFRRAATESSTSRQDIERVVKQKLGEIYNLLFHVCGGEGYPLCSWETKMKEYILSFP
ncbi:hypothetical protein B0H16DRAFT_1418264 [Mycena metata]|uniref:Uncharacterized protein n=1 Tax=Mycena metata TaxID=1033252 RepID=A0AAD7J0L4_9AGAR|nr:hypothetical protein B0H16DRAFT_1418264 [Mycena metata]